MFGSGGRRFRIHTPDLNLSGAHDIQRSLVWAKRQLAHPVEVILRDGRGNLGFGGQIPKGQRPVVIRHDKAAIGGKGV